MRGYSLYWGLEKAFPKDEKETAREVGQSAGKRPPGRGNLLFRTLGKMRNLQSRDGEGEENDVSCEVGSGKPCCSFYSNLNKPLKS